MKPEDVIEERKRWHEYKANYAKEHPELYESSQKFEEDIRVKQARGEIIDPFIKKWLEGEITAARVALTIGIILTALIKGQIFIWAIMYIAYRCRVNKVREDALEADRRKYK